MRGQAPIFPLSNVSAETLDRARRGDAFGPTAGAEPEALAAIARDDDAACHWLAGAQRSDGSFGLTAGPVENDAATGLAALALPPGAECERAGIWHVNDGGRFVGRSDPEQIAQIDEGPERSMTPFDVLPVFEDLKTGSGGAHAGLGDANA